MRKSLYTTYAVIVITVQRQAMFGRIPLLLHSGQEYSKFFPESRILSHSSTSLLQQYTLLARLRVKKRYLLVKVGLGGLSRYAIVLPSGMMYTLSYVEEMREQLGVTGSTNRESAAYVDTILEKIDAPLYMPSLADIDAGVTSWFVSMARRIKRNRKKELVDV